MKRNIVCINLLLKQKRTLKNRVASVMYKKALTSNNFKASVTSKAYGEWLNENLAINVDYTLLHDVYHDYYEHPKLKESQQDIVFCGGCYGRDWPLMMEIAKAVPEVQFCLVMKKMMERQCFAGMSYPENVQVLTDIPYKEFMRCLCQSKVVCMPLDCEAPQGLIVMYEAAANDKLILTSDTPTTKEYFDQGQRLGKDVEEWRHAILYYLKHEDERKVKAQGFHQYLKEECGEKQFAEIVVKMLYGKVS
jgi:glycosyltransferase involved in cell wall biosynthesis